jgi:Protein of unknown function (DUF2971)
LTDLPTRQTYFDYLCSHPNDADGLRSHKEAILGQLSGTCVYKYCNLETGRKILNSGLLLQAPDNFNDPFDCLAQANVWSPEYRFPPEQDDLQYANSKIQELPQKYQLQSYRIFEDMRASYYFAITCFGERHDEHLMWSHYADNHKGLCLGFDARAIIDHIHPCIYTHRMPTQQSWRSGNMALSLIKGSAWAYENEWRLVKKTSRPRMRLIASMAHQIYNTIHSNPAFSTADYEEWGRINNDLMKRLEDAYIEERIVRIKPSAIYLGLNFGHHYANTLSGQICDGIRDAAEGLRIPVKQMQVQADSFDLFTADVTRASDWSQL